MSFFVWIKLATAKNDVFAYMEISKGLLFVGQLSSLACLTFPRWQLDSSQVLIYLISKSGEVKPSQSTIQNALVTIEPLPEESTLENTIGISSGAWLVVKPIYLDLVNTDIVDRSDVISVSEVIGPLFENEARVAMGQIFREVCPWFTSSSIITTRFEMSLNEEKRQADLFAYCSGDTLEPCLSAHEAGVYLVWPDASIESVTFQAQTAVDIIKSAQFSPADTSRLGPHKYFVGEAYSGTVTLRRQEKVLQLESEVEFLMRRLADRNNLQITDITSVIGAAAIVFPTEKGSYRSTQVGPTLKLIRENSGPHLKRLASAGRFLLVLLSADQAPLTAAQRDTTLLLRQMRESQNMQAKQINKLLERL